MTTGLRYQFQYHRTTASKRLSWSPDLAPSICGGVKSPIIHPKRHHQGIFQTNSMLGNVAENWVNISFALLKVAENWVHISFALGNVAENWVNISFALLKVAETDNALMMPRGIVLFLPASAVYVCSFMFNFLKSLKKCRKTTF